MSWDQTTTRKPATAQRPDAVRDLLALTLVCHPDPRRIGERALLPEAAAGHTVRISRSEPDFAPPTGVWGRPLEDPYLSRRPVLLRSGENGGIALDPGDSPIRVKLDGQLVTGEHRVDGSALDAGAVVELAQRIVLVVHRFPEEGPARDEPVAEEETIGASAPMDRVRSSIAQVADLEVPVLLRGESGTGKELAARALHRRSRRAQGPFVAVNLGALPPSLAAAELFGNVKGAFTGAADSRTGYFRAAQGGTLFLDEVGEAPPDVQATLLRALETGEVFPVGSQRAHRLDVRWIAATDADLEKRVRDGSFKKSLLHRLAAYEIWLPPLRQRRDDIGRLFVFFARQQLAEMGDETGFPSFDPDVPPWLPAELMARLARYSWPGNVRQLRNVVRQLVIDNRGRDGLTAGPRVDRLLTGEGGDGTPPPPRKPSEIAAAELEAALRGHRFEPAAAARALGISRPSLYYLIRRHPTLEIAEDLEEQTIREVLEECGGDVVTAARSLQVSPRALQRRLKKLESRREVSK